MTKLHICCRL